MNKSNVIEAELEKAEPTAGCNTLHSLCSLIFIALSMLVLIVAVLFQAFPNSNPSLSCKLILFDLHV